MYNGDFVRKYKFVKLKMWPNNIVFIDILNLKDVNHVKVNFYSILASYQVIFINLQGAMFEI
jgi:hypothetical protein